MRSATFLAILLATSAAFAGGAAPPQTQPPAAPVYPVAMSAALWQETINAVRRTDSLTSREADSLIGIIAGQVNAAAAKQKQKK